MEDIGDGMIEMTVENAYTRNTLARFGRRTVTRDEYERNAEPADSPYTILEARWAFGKFGLRTP